MAINPLTGTPQPGLTALDDPAQDPPDTTGQTGLTGLTALTQTQLGALLGAIQDGDPDTGVDGDTPPLTDGNGAPGLSPPQSFNASDMVALLRMLRSKSLDQQLQTAQTGVEAAKTSAEKNTTDQLAKIKEWSDKCAKAHKSGLLGKIFGWIGKIAAVIASVVAIAVAGVATAATGGAAAPLLALAIVGGIAATMTLASSISQEAGGPALTIGNLVKATVGKFLTDVCGVPKEKADDICGMLGGALALVCPVMLAIEPSLLGDAVSGLLQLSGVDQQTAGYVAMAFTALAAIGVGIAMAVMSGGSSAGATVSQLSQSTAKIIATAGRVTQAVASAASAATQIAQGGAGIATGVYQAQAQNVLADKSALQALMVKLQKQMQDGEDDMKKIIEEIEQSTQIVSQMITGAADSMKQITQNIGAKAMI